MFVSCHYCELNKVIESKIYILSAVYSNAKITHICSVRYFMSKLKYAGNGKIMNALLMH